MIKNLSILLLTFGIGLVSNAQKNYELSSPDGKLKVVIDTKSKELNYSLYFDSKEVISASPISLTVNSNALGANKLKVKKSEKKSINKVEIPAVRQKSASIKDNCNELTMKFDGDFAVTFRAYNDGFAYRFSTSFKDSIIINSEKMQLNFAGNDVKTWFHEEESFMSHNERAYKLQLNSSFTNKQFTSLPIVVESPAGVKIAVGESDVLDYPGLFFEGTSSNALSSKFPPYVTEVKDGEREFFPIKTADFIAKTKGTRDFPWRAFAVVKNDADLASNELVWLLASPNKLTDFSWIKPGKVAWDWWNALNIYGVDFKSGMNTETYKYYIDFASKFGLDYIILDEGWYANNNLLTVVNDINMQELIQYGKSKNVGLILWVSCYALEKRFQPALEQFEKWGVKGIKVDFMQRNDQWMVNWYEKVASEGAKHKLLVDFHGAYKPTGLQRTYPNVLNHEGVRGLENDKWSSDYATPEHDVTIPFTRMWSGPMDYTPGAMNNATKTMFAPLNDVPMSMGTRCHQLAMYVVYDAPLQMLADNPTNYYREPECMEFLSKVPSVWDTTMVVNGEISKYITTVRKSANRWFIGSMTNWDARTLNIDLSFLEPNSEKTLVIFQDGINADRNAKDYKKIVRRVKKGDKLEIKMSQGGGFAGYIY